MTYKKRCHLWKEFKQVITKIKIMKSRLFSNYVTTILGVLIIVFCGAMIFLEKATTEDMAGWLTTGLLFLRSKDSLIALPKEEK